MAEVDVRTEAVSPLPVADVAEHAPQQRLVIAACRSSAAMADAAVRRIALALEGVEEIDSDGFDFRVGGRGFVWSYPERLPGRRRVIRTDVAVLYVGDEAEKQALLLGEPERFFTSPSYDGLPFVMVRSTRSTRNGSASSSPTPGGCGPADQELTADTHWGRWRAHDRGQGRP